LADPNSEIILEFKVLNVEAAGKDKGMAHPGFFYLDANGIIREKYFQEKDTERFTANNVVGKLFPELSDEVTKTVDAPHVKLTLEQSDSEVISGNRISLAAEIELPKGVHVYAPGVQGYRPIELRLNPASGVEFRPVTYPSPRVLYLEAIQEHVPVFEGKFRISQDATVKESTTREVVRSLVAADRVVVITGELAYQACDDKVCYPPATVPVEWRVKVNPLDLKRSPEDIQHR
jgi:DsbC/DsbD-like thiol-disulfide interchange protein